DGDEGADQDAVPDAALHLPGDVHRHPRAGHHQLLEEPVGAARAYDEPVGWRDWPRGAEIEPSIYAADFARLGEQLAELIDGGAKIFQFDVGDGHFVEPITIGPIVLQGISPLFRRPGRSLAL